MGIVEVVREAFSREAILALSRMLEESPDKVNAAVQASIPTILLLLSGKASHPQGADEVLVAATERGPAVMDHVAQQVRDADAPVHSALGMRRMNRLLGRDSAEGLVYAVSRFSGLSLGSARVITGLVGLSSMEAVGRLCSPRDVSGVMACLGQQQGDFAGAVPAGLYEYLEAVPPLRSLAHQYDGAQPATSTGDAMQGESELPRQESARNEQYCEMDNEKERAPAAMTWAIPILIVLAIAAAMLFTFYPRNANNPVTVVRPIEGLQQPNRSQAQPAAAQLPAAGTASPFGIGDLAYLDNAPLRASLMDAFQRLSAALHDVRDPQSAANAKGELERVSQDLQQAQPSITTLPAGAQTRLAEEIQRAWPSISEAANTASNQPGGQAIQPTIQQILRQLQEIQRSRQS